MDNRRVIQFTIPLLSGIAIGILVAWGVEALLPARDAVSKFGTLLAVGAIFAAMLLKMRTGYNWPWEGSTEWDQARPILTKVYLRYFVGWIVVVLLLLVFFTLWQFPGFR